MNRTDRLDVATRLLDPRFKYTPSLATNIAATWKRYGFDPRANEQRRRQALESVVSSANDAFEPRKLTVVNG
jgi:hypothetical protein